MPTDGLRLFRKNHKHTLYNYRLYSLIEEDKKVLDVGCATGELLKNLKEKKSCYTVGIEVDEEMAKEAQEKCDQLILGDIEMLNEPPFSANFFDIIILGDVLEHMRRPDEVLRKLKDYLRENGYIFVSIPNVAFISVRFGLLFGRFNYTEYGPLDKSHLRFFTLKTAKRLIEENGYKITHLEGYNQIRARYFLLKPLGRLWKTLFATDFIIKAVKKKV